VPERLYVFIQFEFPWTLGPADGRYLIRAGPDAEPERVIVLGTLGAPLMRVGQTRPRPPGGRLRARLAPRPATRPATPEPAPVPTARATIIDPVPLSAESQARAWLADLDGEREIDTAAGVLNRVLHAHRIAAADPGVHEIAPAQALVIRAGWGEGEQVADGRWVHARELTADAVRARSGARRGARRDRSAALRPQERLAALLGGRTSMLVCEELVLRARLDLDNARPAHAAIQLDAAYAAAVSELAAEGRHDLAIRLDELRSLQPQVGEQARAVLDGRTAAIDDEALEHAMGRLESALRARTAPGFNV
jgi:hypothetical protein